MSKKKTYKVAMLKDRKTSNTEAGKLSDKVFVTLTWFKSTGFRSYDEDQKKRYVKSVLQDVDRRDVSDKFDIGSEEELIINEKPRYSVDQAVLRDDFSMPSHLIDNDKKTGVSSSW